MSSAFEMLAPTQAVMHTSKETGGLSQLDIVLTQARERAKSDEFVVMYELFESGVEVITITIGATHPQPAPAVESVEPPQETLVLKATATASLDIGDGTKDVGPVTFNFEVPPLPPGYTMVPTPEEAAAAAAAAAVVEATPAQ